VVAETLGEIALDIARGLVLQALTFGGYGSYQMGKAMREGYQEDGLPGALNAVNPLYWIGRGAADTYIAAEKGDYRAATAAGVKTAVVVAATAATAAQGVGAVARGTAGARGMQPSVRRVRQRDSARFQSSRGTGS
jgi:L-serine deaminase